MLRQVFVIWIVSVGVLAFWAPVSAEASARSCSSLFVSNDAEFSSKVGTRLKFSAQEFRKQIEDRTALENIKLTITPALSETFAFLRRETKTIESGEFHSLLDRTGLLSARYENVINGLNRFESSQTISYFDYFQIAEQFSVLMTARLINRTPLEFDLRAQAERLEKLLSAPLNRSTEKIAENRSEWLFLPLAVDIGVPTMNELQAMGVAVVGLTLKASNVDAQTFLPDGFFYHDFAHAFNYERQPFRTAGLTGWMAGGVRRPSQSFSSRLTFFRAFREDQVRPDGSKISERAHLIRENLWFLAFHEAGFPMHSANLRSELERFDKYFDPIFRRLSNVMDLGFAFRHQALTEAEVRREIESLRLFVESVKSRY